MPDLTAMRCAALCIFSVAFMSVISIPASAQMAIPKAKPVTGEKLFGQQCGACHATKAGETRVGPSLAGIIGRKAASQRGYRYSPALRKSGLTWTRDNMDKWLTNSGTTVRGTIMIYSQADAAKRRAIINYLNTLPK